MTAFLSCRTAFAAGALLFCFAAPVAAAPPGPFTSTVLVTSDPVDHPGQITDTGLKNAWGISYAPSGPFWVSSSGAGTSPLYRVDPVTQATTKLDLTVAIPGAGVTGQVFNKAAATSFGGNVFLFVNGDGTVSGWRPALGTSAETLVPAAANRSYTGAAFATVGDHGYLYASNVGAGTIDVYKGSDAAPALEGSFVDPGLPAGYTPFNVQNLADTLYVSYVGREPGSDGVINRFDLQGNFLGRVADGGPLNAPWGLAIAPSSFGDWAGALLVGNFGDGRISAYDPDSFALLGQLQGADGQPLVLDGLWALTPGNDQAAGSSSLLYYSAGPEGETEGVFGVLRPVPEPGTWLMMAGGLAMLAFARRSRRGQA
ncbi:TIGR03118 family protein [Caldimonas brevitalea]|uniref:Ice-binding protein C-terminal domain-containing protein n=1 Tax=Caldimonas brevitalea TaxID=413882 RepID=A0A0G3BGA0_9BURK|nr:TIGR03118 family protein [Caldimonas brevitalea]AKJ28454.1 hypothetical protein AAW51_1763 [Caldimonas brevitalea]